MPSVSTTAISAAPALDRRLVRAHEELAVGTRRVDAEEAHADVVLRGEAHRSRDPLQHRLAAHAERLELAVRDRALDHRGPNAELDECLHVGGDGAREAPDLGAQAGSGNQLDRAPVVRGDAREAGFDAVDPGRVERACDLELVLRGEHDADRLLAVAKRRVVETDGDVRLLRRGLPR